MYSMRRICFLFHEENKVFMFLLPPAHVAVEAVGDGERPAQDYGETGEVTMRREKVSKL